MQLRSASHAEIEIQEFITNQDEEFSDLTTKLLFKAVNRMKLEAYVGCGQFYQNTV